MGRSFTPEEDKIGGPIAVMISHRAFMQRFGGDPAALGRSLVVSDEPMELIGVMPPGFDYPESESIRVLDSDA